MNYLQLINSVLVRLRELPVATNSATEYSTLIGLFVNQIKEEMEDAHYWQSLRRTIGVTTTPGTFRYDLTESGSRSRILSVWNDTDSVWLRHKTRRQLTQSLSHINAVQGTPAYWGINGTNPAGDLLVDLDNNPDGVYLIDFNMVVPDTVLSDDDHTPAMDQRALVLGAYALAVSERGEDGGVTFQEADMRYRAALGDLISIDAQHAEDEYTLRVV